MIVETVQAEIVIFVTIQMINISIAFKKRKVVLLPFLKAVVFYAMRKVKSRRPYIYNDRSSLK